MPYPVLPGPDWLGEPTMVCATHGRAIHWRCRACLVNLCAGCMVAEEGGRQVHPQCDSVIVAQLWEIPKEDYTPKPRPPRRKRGERATKTEAQDVSPWDI